MDYTRKLYKFTPKPEALTAKQRRRVRDLLAFVHATGDATGGLVSKHVAATIVCYATGFDIGSRNVVVDSRALSDYDVTNHPFVNLCAILKTRGYRYSTERRSHGRPQKWVRFYYIDSDETGHRRPHVTLCNITSSVYISGKHPAGTFELVRNYAKQVGCDCYERHSEAVA